MTKPIPIKPRLEKDSSKADSSSPKLNADLLFTAGPNANVGKFQNEEEVKASTMRRTANIFCRISEDYHFECIKETIKAALLKMKENRVDIAILGLCGIGVNLSYVPWTRGKPRGYLESKYYDIVGKVIQELRNGNQLTGVESIYVCGIASAPNKTEDYYKGMTSADQKLQEAYKYYYRNFPDELK